jgi:Zn-dependent peptidase ImmA (M78 family)
VTTDTPAEAIIRRLGITQPQEIDLEAVAWHLGVRVRYRPLGRCEARIIGVGDHAVITVNTHSSRRRKRFSIGHELGHWHHDRGRLLFCQTEDIGRAAPGSLSSERIADRFASSLLMPEFLFRPIARHFSKIDFEAVRKIADAFDTSITATAMRLVEAGYFVGCLVCHGSRGRKWFARSHEVPDRWFPREDLAPDGFAIDVLFGRTQDNRFPRKVGADAWFDRWEAERYEVHEQTIRVGDDEILTLVRMDDGSMLS